MAGALHPRALPVAACVVGLGLALLVRRPVLVVGAVALLASAASHAAWAGLAPLPDQPFHGTVTLVRDPTEGLGGQVRVDARLPDGARVEVVAADGAGALLGARAAGERVLLDGRIRPPPDRAPWLVPRHVRGRLEVEQVAGWRAGEPVGRAANVLRRTLVRGAASLPEDRRALFSGLVLGDDRAQSDEDVDAFRAAGLGHLLAVSGQNVAFVLVLVHPLVARLGARGRLLVVVAVLGFFACVTRFEPSVLRAVAMAGVAAVATTSGRRVGGVQVLGVAVAVLVLVDPLLVHALAFRLSVAASLGILLVGPWVRDRLPGPRWLAEAVAVTVSAQAAVAPLLLAAFGPVPVAALPANVLAAPAAGPVTVWGLTAGLVAGIVPALGPVLHLPTGVLLWWIDLVAHLAVRVPLGGLGGAAVALLVVTGAIALGGRGLARPLACGCVLLLLAQPAVSLRSDVARSVDLGAGAVLHRAGGGAVLVVDGRARPAPLLADLRRVGTTHLDLVVLPTGRSVVLAALRERHPDLAVAAPGGSGRAEHVVAERTTLVVGALEVRLEARGQRLEVSVEVVGDGAAAARSVGAVR